VNLDFSEEQQVLRDTVRKLCAEYSPIAVVRAMEDDPKGVPDALWKQLAELGLLGVLVPEEYGGSAQTLLEAVIVFEELGRALAPTPAFESAVMSAGVLSRRQRRPEEGVAAEDCERRGDPHAGLAGAAERLRP
jgi:alkylation response protein AidB-like acyl-CoA dehydrogenase